MWYVTSTLRRHQLKFMQPSVKHVFFPTRSSNGVSKKMFARDLLIYISFIFNPYQANVLSLYLLKTLDK